MTHATTKGTKMRALTTKKAVASLLLTACFLLALCSVPGAWAECTNAAGNLDTDCDGFLDSEETGGLVPLPLSGMTFTETGATGEAGPRLFTDPTVPDIFVIMQPATCNKFPTPLLNYVTAPIANGGLGVAVHLVTQSGASSRTITQNAAGAAVQKAITVSESCSPLPTTKGTAILLGITTQGDPNGLDSTTVYTVRIEEFIKKICGSLYPGPACRDDLGNYGPALVNRYVRYVANHEVGHDMKLADVSAEYFTLYNGNHLPPGSRVMMEQEARYSKTRTTVIWSLADTFDPVSQASSVLHTY